MKTIARHLSTWIALAAMAIGVAAVPASAQDRAGATPPSGGGGGGAAASAPSGGGGGGSSTSGGGGGGGGAVDRAGASPGGFGGGNRGEAGGHGGATGGSGVAVPRGDYSVGRYSEGSSHSNASAGRRGDGDREGVPEFSRPRDGAATDGKAVPRPAGSVPPTLGGGTNIIYPGGYYGGYGYGYPCGYGYGCSYYGGFYGGYYDPFYDPWYGGYYSSYGYSQSSGFSVGSDEGKLRLKVKPREAEVYVDGYYVGLVDEFDGMFQRLHIEPGPHRIEVRAAGYEPLVFEVRISPDHTTTYQGEMKKVQ